MTCGPFEHDKRQAGWKPPVVLASHNCRDKAATGIAVSTHRPQRVADKIDGADNFSSWRK